HRQGPGPIHPAAPQARLDGMVASQEDIDRARAAAEAARGEKRPRVVLPPIVPGFLGNSDAFPIPHKVDDAAYKGEYVSYAALTPAAREKAFKGEELEFTLSTGGTIVSKPSDSRASDHAISYEEWVVAARSAEDLATTYHPGKRAMALAAHHRVVGEICRKYDWPIAREYDIQQRMVAARDPRHDLATKDVGALSETVIAVRTKQAVTAAVAQAAPQLRQARDVRPPHAQTKRYQPYDTSKRAEADTSDKLCFRCGRTGHLPAACTAETTIANIPAATLDHTKNARSPHALVASDGRAYCFNWASRGACKNGRKCYNAHTCSICASTGHGAGSCDRV
ncbi:hypothetical protein LXA43DRAFT_1038201, partial [Ganoderma leucocontextum]